MPPKRPPPAPSLEKVSKTKKPKLHRSLVQIEFVDESGGGTGAGGKGKSKKKGSDGGGGGGGRAGGSKKVKAKAKAKTTTTTTSRTQTTKNKGTKAKKDKAKKKAAADIYKGQTVIKKFPGESTLYKGKVGSLEEVRGRKEPMYLLKFQDGDTEHPRAGDLSELLCEDRNLVGRKFKVLEIEGDGGESEVKGEVMREGKVQGQGVCYDIGWEGRKNERMKKAQLMVLLVAHFGLDPAKYLLKKGKR